jgi:predicted RNA polymerase sigma factor
MLLQSAEACGLLALHAAASTAEATDWPQIAARAYLLRRSNQRAFELCGIPAERAYLLRRLDEMLKTVVK